jgi:hypothetical protein
MRGNEMGDLHSELMAIREKRGKLTPRIVYEEAKVKTHPLHTQVIDMPVKEAAEAHYIANAARLLRVTFKETMSDGHTANLRHFWVQKGTKKDPESQYVPIQEVIQDPLSKAVMLRQMLRDWKRFKSRYQSYAEFAEMVLSDPDFTDPDQEFGDEGNGSEG